MENRIIPETELEVGDIYRPYTPISSQGFMTAVVIKKEINPDRASNEMLTVKRPFVHSRLNNFEEGCETFSFWPNKNFKVELLDRDRS